MEMNPIDAGLLVIIGINLILGLLRGAIWQVLKLAGIALGVWGAMQYGARFQQMWPDAIRVEGGSGELLAQGVLFLSIYIVVFGISHLLQSLIKKIDLGSLDRLLGGLVGAAKGALIGSVILYLQFLPFVTNFDTVKDWLYGNSERGISPSVGNEIFIQHVYDRLDSIVPTELKRKTDSYLADPNTSLAPRKR
ncbi:MAG: CvpA family protein [Planctomycetota bacterium]